MRLTLNLLTTTIVAPPSKASKWQMGFNTAFKGLIDRTKQLAKAGTACVKMKHELAMHIYPQISLCILRCGYPD